jgi:hypothetical protein
MKLVRMMTMPLMALALLLVASGCGSSPAATGSSSPEQSQQAGQSPQGGGQQGRMPGANGTIVDVSGSTMQVQDMRSDQVAVTWTGKTSFTREAGGALSDIAVGDCVMVTSDATGSASSVPTKVTATSVRVTKPTGGSCTIGGGGRGGLGSGRPGGAPPGGANGGPSGRPSGRPGGRPVGAGVFGAVKAMAGGGFTVTSQGFGQDTASTSVTVTTTSRTTVSRTVAATSKAVATGLCVSARGTTDDTGAVTATSVALSQPVNGACGVGFGRPGGAGGPSGSAES